VSCNGSTDGSPGIALQATVGNPNLIFFHHATNRGAFANFEFLLAQSKTPYFCLLGGHDVLDPTFAQRALWAFELMPTASLVYPLTRLIDRQGHPITSERPYVGCTPATDDVDTCGDDDVDGPLKVARNEHNAHAFNGLFRTDTLRGSTFYRVAAIT
jgi:glycosyltransferase involved in cell wall biosynthesis